MLVEGPVVEHIARTFEHDLTAVREELLLMAGHVEAMISRASRAFCERDVELARATMDLDRAVNRAEIEIDEACLRMLGRWQPMASDLRFVTIVMKMVTDLERIGDLAVNVCERAIDLDGKGPLVVHPDIATMTTQVESMVKDAIDALVSRNATRAWGVIHRDGEIDALYHRVFSDVIAQMAVDSSRVPLLIHVQSVAKWLERIADHATNLAEMVIFLVEGRDVRHPREQGGR